MRENTEAVVIEANFNEINQKGLSGVGQDIEELYPDHRVEFYGAVADNILFVLRPK